MNTQKIWMVTGASKGLGSSLVQKLLSQGYKVAATSRNLKDLNEETADFLPLQVDLLNEQSIAQAVASAINKFGKIDVLVNNAGYGQIGTLEELTDAEARANFDVNVFGSLNFIRGIMPHLRAQKSGAIFNISSIGGFTGNFPGWGIYCATKFAMAGFTESLSAEAKEFGVSATVVYPGYFRTSFLKEGSLTLPKNPIAEYTGARELEAAHVNQIDNNQAGDPDKAAAVLIEIAEQAERPLHLFLGQDAYDMANAKIEAVQNDLAATKSLTISTGF
jgi:NAD(P)-dependent dehydrogenase (short-subunit alcohol dehydrogenase family)